MPDLMRMRKSSRRPGGGSPLQSSDILAVWCPWSAEATGPARGVQSPDSSPAAKAFLAIVRWAVECACALFHGRAAAASHADTINRVLPSGRCSPKAAKAL